MDRPLRSTADGDESAVPLVDRGLDRVARRGRAGDRDALATIYRELSPAVLGYARARGSLDPESVTSEVFVQVVRRAHALPDDWQGVRTFVFRAAHSRLVDEHRRALVRGVHLAYDQESDARAVGSAEDAALGALDLEGLLGLLDLLPTDQRAVVTLRFVADLSLLQTAAVMGRSMSWVGQQQNTALGILRRYVVREPTTGSGGEHRDRA